MKSPINRRDTLKGALVGAASALGIGGAGASAKAQQRGQAPAIKTDTIKPVVISSGNGNIYKNGGRRTCVEEAFRRMTRGEDVLDALIAGVNIVELDPEDTSVGFGGLPDADGVVTLDSCCMHGPKKRAGGVAAIQGVRTPSNVAQFVADRTDHHLIVAEGAQRFARNMGMEIEDDLNTDRSRALWLEWKQRTDPRHYPDPERRADAGRKVALEMVAEGKIDPEHFYGTINCNGVNSNGDICGVTTTSGLAWKIPGRVGDSPILGAGLYLDNAVGAAGSTGRGEANLYNCASYLIVEEMRRGADPKDAAVTALKRIHENTESRLLKDDGNPAFNVNFYVLDKQGRHAGVAFYSNGKKRTYAACDENGPRSILIEGIYGDQAG
ncbi:MAG: N(4)-(beta-N-acetylglucosaminyl)-L-asparaginase [Pseudomonadota bacterium]